MTITRHGYSDNYFSDWHTPNYIIDRVKQLYGGTIDLDPCTDEIAQKSIQATSFFTKEDNGLLQLWFGNIYLNYPGGRTGKYSNSTIWFDKAEREFTKTEEVENIVICLFSVEHLNINPNMFSYTLCFLRDRIPFVRNNVVSKPSHNNALLLMSKTESKKKEFKDLFGYLGVVGQFVVL